jgi:hypothetical protein
MALDIIKAGKDPKDQWVYFKCLRCGCEFRVTMDETVKGYAMVDYNEYCEKYVSDCPSCGKRLVGKLYQRSDIYG